MRLVLDTNEFILALEPGPDSSSLLLFKKLIDSFPKHTIHVPRIIMNEARKNLAPFLFSELIKTIHEIATIDENILAPFELGAKYERLGLKPADALIAAYCEWIQADMLVSENRHFLNSVKRLPFKVLSARVCLKLLR